MKLEVKSAKEILDKLENETDKLYILIEFDNPPLFPERGEGKLDLMVQAKVMTKGMGTKKRNQYFDDTIDKLANQITDKWKPDLEGKKVCLCGDHCIKIFTNNGYYCKNCKLLIDSSRT